MFDVSTLIPLLGAIQDVEHDDDSLPVGLQAAWFSVEHLHVEGGETHACPMGMFDSPYPNDAGFHLVVYPSRDILRWGEYTPDVCYDWGAAALASQKAYDMDHHYDWTLLENGIAPSVKQFSNAWLENRSEQWDRNNNDWLRPLSDGLATLIAPLVLAFSHEHEPWWVREFLTMAGQWKPTRRRGAVTPSAESFSWGHVFEQTAIRLFTRYPQYSRSIGIRGAAFAKVVAYLAAEYVKKRFPGASIQYTLENDSPCHKVPISACIGLILPWSNGRVVPFLSADDKLAVNLAVRKITLQGIAAKQQEENGEETDNERMANAIGLVSTKFGPKAGGIIGNFMKNLESMGVSRLPPNVSDTILSFVGFPVVPDVEDGGDGGDNGGGNGGDNAKRRRLE